MAEHFFFWWICTPVNENANETAMKPVASPKNTDCAAIFLPNPDKMRYNSKIAQYMLSAGKVSFMLSLRSWIFIMQLLFKDQRIAEIEMSGAVRNGVRSAILVTNNL